MGCIYSSYRGHGVRYIIRVFTNKLIEVDYRSARVSATTKIFVDIPSLLKKSNTAKYPYLSIVGVSEIRPPTRKIVPRNFPSSLEFTRNPGNDNDPYLRVQQSYKVHRNRSKFWEKEIQLSWFYLEVCSKFLDDLRLGGTDYIDREFFINPLFFIIIRDWIDNRNSVIEDMILSYEFNHFIFYLTFMRNIEVEVRLCFYRYKYIFIKLFFESLKKRRFFFFYYKSKVSFLYFHYSVSYQIYLNISNKRYREQ